MSDLLTDLATASRHWAGEGTTGAMLSAMRAFLSEVARDESLQREAAAALDAQSPGAAAWTAVALGTAVEQGAPAEASGPAVLAQLRAWLPKLPAETDPTPAQKRLLAVFPFLCRSAVTHLARLPDLRAELGRDATLVARLDGIGAWSHGALWVREALLKASGTLVLLHPPSGTGLRLAYSNVSFNFHLFSLLQTAVGTSLAGGRIPDETIARVARGQSSEPVTDAAWWHYGVPSSPKADLGASIWGEGLVSELARVNGEAVILLWPPLLRGRQWDAGFLGPHLEVMPADANVERMLTPEESRAWLTTLGIGSTSRPWWKFW